MPKRFRFHGGVSPPGDLTTMEGLRNEVYTAVVRYFAPLVALYEEIEKTAGMPTAWQRKKLDQDHTLSDGE
jgi:hypothetical protein